MKKMVHTFLGHHKVSRLNHMLFALGHLNAIKYFKCPNNHKLKCLLLEIFQTVGMRSFMICDLVLVIFNKALKLQKNRKKEIKEMERTHLALPGSPLAA